MAKRRHNGPPLYDLITSRSHPRQEPPAHEPEPREPLDEESPDPLGWVNPGRKVAFPVGYVFVAIAAALTIVILAYVFGHTRGEDVAEATIDEDLRDAWLAEDQARNTADPLVAARTSEYQPPTSINRQPQSPGNAGNDAVGGEQSASGQTPGSGGGSIPVVFDPRQSGRNYYVLATTRRDGAIRLAEFCRARGLEAYVVGGHNARFSQVIALPALTSTASTDSLTRSMREQILRIGREWQRSEPGATDLSDAYVQLYRK